MCYDRHMMDLLGQSSLHGEASAGSKRRILSSFLPSVPSIVAQHSHKVTWGGHEEVKCKMDV